MQNSNDLLQLRFCDLSSQLGMELAGPYWQRCQYWVRKLWQRGLDVEPDFWIAREFFVVDGESAVALPFYLFNSQLKSLHFKKTRCLEGVRMDSFDRLLRHELGHVVDNAFSCRKHPERQKVFGPSTRRYSSYYDFQPHSRKFVRNLADGYAQSHPDEDFAETFAVWLGSKSEWKQKYRNWPVANQKLQYMERLMSSLKGTKPLVKTSSFEGCIQQSKQRLQTFYKNYDQYISFIQPQGQRQRWNRFLIADKAKRKKVSLTSSDTHRALVAKVSESSDVRSYEIRRVVRDLRVQGKGQMDPECSIEELARFLKQEVKRYRQSGWFRACR